MAIKGRYYHYLVIVMVFQTAAAICTYEWTPETPMWIKVVAMNAEGYAFGAVFVATMVALVADIEHKGKANTLFFFLFVGNRGREKHPIHFFFWIQNRNCFGDINVVFM